MEFQRASGILLHPTSFPGKYGIGDFGKEAYNFVEFLAKSKQKLWQILPLNYPGFGNSPYSPISTFAGNPLLISPEKLQMDGYLSEDDLSNLPKFNSEKVEFEKVIEFKKRVFKKAYLSFNNDKAIEEKRNFREFCFQNAYWLDDFAIFTSLREYHKGILWNKWREVEIEKLTNKLADEISFHKFLQFKFYQQWLKLKLFANSKGIQVIGDIPIFVSYDSADVWKNKEQFFLDENGNPEVVAGVPPDSFSKKGQLWGNPLYNWQKMEKCDFDWWQKRISHLFKIVDYVRVDHFIGFVRYWAVPFGKKTAVNGKWRKGPGKNFFSVMEKKLGKLPIIAEDLGLLTQEVINLKEQFAFPGMKILQFSFGKNDIPPHKFEQNCVVYTGTHDNDTTLGWFKHIKKYEKKIYERVKKYLKSNGENICWDMIELAFSTPANWAIIPLQDILCLDSDAKMNLPGTIKGNWQWRYKRDMLLDEIAEKLANLTNAPDNLRTC